MALKKQIDDKKKVTGENKRKDNLYFDVIKSNLENFAKEKENKLKVSQEKVNVYRDLLNRQVTEKEKRRCFMDEKEKQYNKELIGKIMTEFNLEEDNDGVDVNDYVY